MTLAVPPGLTGRFSVLLTDLCTIPALWFLESVREANRNGGDLRVTALVRNPDRFRARWPQIVEDPAIELLKGDLTKTRLPDREFDGIVHLDDSRDKVFDSVVLGTRRLLEWARGQSRLLYMSTGAVYGTPPAGMERIPETWSGAPDPMFSASSEGLCRRMAENLCVVAAEQSSLQVVIARVFNALGPHFPTEPTRALGSFLADALRGGPVVVRGDGTELRSYLYSTDLVRYLWILLLKGRNGEAYNVAGERVVNRRELAETVARAAGNLGLTVEKPAPAGAAPSRFVGDTTKIRSEFGLEESIDLETAVERTWASLKEERDRDRTDLARARADEMNLLTDQV